MSYPVTINEKRAAEGLPSMDAKRIGVLDVSVKDASDEGSGEFEAVLSTGSLDRDGEIVDPKAFDPLPESIVIHTDHVFSVDNAVARAVPRYEGDKLVIRGFYSSDPRAQAVRAKVREGIITTMSAGFMSAQRTDKDGTPHVTKGELLEGSFVTVPSNRDALVLASKMSKAPAHIIGNREALVLPAKMAEATCDADLLQKLHDLSVSRGATCEHKHAPSTEPTEPAMAAAPATAKTPADVARIVMARALADAASVA